MKICTSTVLHICIRTHTNIWTCSHTRSYILARRQLIFFLFSANYWHILGSILLQHLPILKCLLFGVLLVENLKSISDHSTLESQTMSKFHQLDPRLSTEKANQWQKYWVSTFATWWVSISYIAILFPEKRFVLNASLNLICFAKRRILSGDPYRPVS